MSTLDNITVAGSNYDINDARIQFDNTDVKKYLRHDGVWGTPIDYDIGDTKKYLRHDGVWDTPLDYDGNDANKYLRHDGVWSVPESTGYSKNEINYKLAGGGYFVNFHDDVVLYKSQIKIIEYTKSDLVRMFGTFNTAKIHVISTDMLRVCSHNYGYSEKAWANSYYYNSGVNCTYHIPHVELFDLNTYPYLEDRYGQVYLYNPNQYSNSETVTYRIFAFVEN